MATVGSSKRFALGSMLVRYPCEVCGFYFHEGMPRTHLTGCPRETDEVLIREHQLREFGRALSALFTTANHTVDATGTK